MATNTSLRLLSSSLRNAPRSIPRSKLAVRSLHQRRALLYPEETGVGNFLPPEALKTVVQWQDGLLERLNEEVKGTAEENATVAQTVINTSVSRDKALAFNYASLALNNSYFLDNIKPPPLEGSHEAEISRELHSAITEQYGSIRQLKSSFSAAALGMFTSGWVWFVADSRGVTGILPTFGPGTLLVRSRQYMAAEQGLSLGDLYASPREDGASSVSPIAKSPLPGVSPSSPTSGVSSPISPQPPKDVGPRFFHTSIASQVNFSSAGKSSLYGNVSQNLSREKLPTILNVGEVLYPLFCLSVNEHAWLSAGYGVWGKEAWLKEFWSVVDWEKASQAYKRALNVKSSLTS
ncbi:hypothetical protein MD484_g3906, partial [Candolleomyces efflorescens]